MSSRVAEGRAAFDRESWIEACTLLSAADRESPLDPDDLDRLASAARLIGRDAEALDARARAHQGFVDRGDLPRAARSAFWMMFALVDLPGRQSEAAGWFMRARRLLDEHGQPCAEQALLACATGYQAVTSGQLDAALEDFREGARIGARFGDADALALAAHGEGRVLIRQARAKEGLALLDELMVSVTRAGAAPLVAGVVYCGAIGACYELFDWPRAREWTAALSAWCDAHPDMVPFRGTCLVRRSEVLLQHGDWERALGEAMRACAWLGVHDAPAVVGAAQYQLAELHRLRGDLDDAEAAYRRAGQCGCRVHPGLALLRLASGQTDAAVAAIRLALEDTTERRARPPVLRGAVDILVAAGETAAARDAAVELGRLATEIDAPCLHAMAATAEGAVLLANAEARAALPRLRAAEGLWQSLEVPYDVARTRVLLGRVFRALGDDEGAALQFEAAQEAFERLGAAPDAALVASLSHEAPAPAARGGLTGREVEVLRLVAAGKSNKAIAAALSISEKTVARHLSNIFTKLDLPSRSAATAYAYAHKIV